MFETIKNAFGTKEIRVKIWATLLLLLVYRIGCFIPVPGLNVSIISDALKGSSASSFLNVISAITGGSLSQGTLFALGIIPFINSFIIMQLLTLIIPKLEEMSKDGEEGRKKSRKSLVTSQSYSQWFKPSALRFVEELHQPHLRHAKELACDDLRNRNSRRRQRNGHVAGRKNHGIRHRQRYVAYHLRRYSFNGGHLASERVQNRPHRSQQTLEHFRVLNPRPGTLCVHRLYGRWRKKNHGAICKQVKGNKMYGGQTTFIPIRVNASGVMPIIFASSFIMFPQMIISFIPKLAESKFGVWWMRNLTTSGGTWWGSLIYYIFMVVFIIFFAYFYSMIQFNPEDVSKNIQQYGGFIPGIRPGKPTSDYLKRINNRITLFGAIFLSIICVIPTFLFNVIGKDIGLSSAFSATGLLIVVSVALEFNKSLESQIMMRHYKGFLK